MMVYEIIGWIVLTLLALGFLAGCLILAFVLIMYGRNDITEWLYSAIFGIIGFVLGYMALGNIPFTILINSA